MQEGHGSLLSLLSELTATSPFDRPPLAQVLGACRLHSRSLKPQVVLGAAVRRAVGHSSTVRACTLHKQVTQPHPSPLPPHTQDSLASISSGELSLASSVSMSSLASVGSRGRLTMPNSYLPQVTCACIWPPCHCSLSCCRYSLLEKTIKGNTQEVCWYVVTEVVWCGAVPPLSSLADCSSLWQ